MTDSVSQNELVYRAIKADLLKGRYSPGQRLESRILSDRYASSSTPVRMALSRLVGEGLVEIHANDGFHVPLVTAKSVANLFGFRNDQLINALVLTQHAGDADTKTASVQADLAFPPNSADLLFHVIAAGSGNSEYEAAVANINDRLHLIGQFESVLFGNDTDEIRAIYLAWHSANWLEAKTLITEYHRRRQSNAVELVKLLYLPR